MALLVSPLKCRKSIALHRINHDIILLHNILKDNIKPTNKSKSSFSMPNYVISGNEQSFQIDVELPGVKTENVDVKVKEEILSLIATRFHDRITHLGNEDVLSEKVSDPNSGGITEQRNVQEPVLNYLSKVRLSQTVDSNAGKTVGLRNGILEQVIPCRKTSTPRVPIDLQNSQKAAHAKTTSVKNSILLDESFWLPSHTTSRFGRLQKRLMSKSIWSIKVDKTNLPPVSTASPSRHFTVTCSDHETQDKISCLLVNNRTALSSSFWF